MFIKPGQIIATPNQYMMIRKKLDISGKVEEIASLNSSQQLHQNHTISN
jgi:hypothetical protein